MGNPNDRDEPVDDELAGGDLGGPYARDTGQGGDDYAREGGFSGAGGRNDYARDTVDPMPVDEEVNRENRTSPIGKASE